MSASASDPNDAGSICICHTDIQAFCFVAGVVLATFAEAFASTALSMARLDMIGDTYATPDEFVTLHVGYTAAKLTAFISTPWLMGRLTPQVCLRAATGILTLVCGASALTSNLETLVVLRVFQGLAGGALLVSAQALLFQTFPRSTQPVVQCLFAIGAVVAPATLTPYMQGWLLDTLSWTWIFLTIVPIGLTALTLLASTNLGADARLRAVRLDWLGLALFAGAAVCLTYILSQGSRWNWFHEPLIVRMAVVGVASLMLLIVYQLYTTRAGTLLDLSVFRNDGFAFGFIASFAAGFALFGSSYLIPSFAISVLRMTPTEAGMLLLPSSLMFIGALLLTALLIRRLRLRPMITVPFGVLGFIVAMWMLSGSNGESGIPDLMPAVLLRGLALGFLFLSITLITLLDLKGSAIAYGVGLFNIGRQAGGLLGVAFLETLIDQHTSLNRAVLAAHLVPGRVTVKEQLEMVSRQLAVHGMEASAATKAAVQMLAAKVTTQASIIAYDTAFLAVALFFFAAVPILIAARIIIRRNVGAQPAKSS